MKSRLFFHSLLATAFLKPDFKRSSLFRRFILTLLASLFVFTGSEALADISFVKTIGTAATSTAGTTTSVTIPAAGVAAGNSIIVLIAINPSTGTVSCSDSVGNTYSTDRDITNGSGTSGIRTVILSAHNVIALISGNTITCSHPSVSARALSANEFAGIAPSTPRDQTSAGIGSSTAPSSGSTAPTTQAVELLLGAIGVEGPTTETFTPGTSYATIGRAGTSGGSAASNITVNPEYRLVTATGAYSAGGTLSNSRKWAAAIVTYKAGLPTRLAITSVNGGTNPAAGLGFSVVVQAQDAAGIARTVTTATGLILSLKAGTGTLGGTLAGTIPAGTNQVTISGVTYSKAETGVVLTASRTSGDALTAADSASFAVNPGAASSLAFTTQPGNATVGGPIPGPPTVTVRDSFGNTVTSSTASITVAIGTNPGGGVLSGTTIRNATSGIASFSDLSINQAGSGYTLTASSTGLPGATSSAFNITASGSVAGTISRAGTGEPISGALVEALQSGVVKASTTSAANGNYTISNLEIGTYGVRASAGGFAPQTQTGITVGSGASTVVNFSLNVAPAASGIVYAHDELGRLKAVVDPVGEAATYAYDAVGNLLGISHYNSSQVSIIDFDPNSGLIGTSVTIYGTGYSTTPTQNTVTFNGVPATVTSATATQIVTTVPSGATTGPVSVATPTGSATSGTNFTVTSSTGAPTISGFTPAIGTPGTAVTITGANFDPAAANNKVKFNISFASVTSSTPTTINTSVPTGTGSGRISLVTPLGNGVSIADFFIPPAPYVAADVVSTGRMAIGGSSQTITISGANKAALVVFDGTAGQQVSLGISNLTFSPPPAVVIYKPDGTIFVSVVVGATGGTIGPYTLPVTGTYVLLVASNVINTIAGIGPSGYNGGYSGDGGPATSAQLNSPYRVALDGQGNLFIADEDNHRIRKVSPSGTITTVAGNGIAGYSGDGGPATSAQLNMPTGVALDGQGNLFIADRFNSRIRKGSTTGTITTVAGNGTAGYSGDGGLATSAQIYNPTDVALDGQGNLFIADEQNQRIRKVSTGGTITTVAGNGTAGYSGDGGPATSAKLYYPKGVALDSQGNLFIADGSSRVRKVSTSGIITTVAGGGCCSIGDGGPATSARLSASDVHVDGQGNLFIADNTRIRKVNTNGIITTVAGNGTIGFSGDGGLPTNAQFYGATGVVLDGQGNLFITDPFNNRVRKITLPTGAMTLTLTSP